MRQVGGKIQGQVLGRGSQASAPESEFRDALAPNT
jgi:hypothetical protein